MGTQGIEGAVKQPLPENVRIFSFEMECYDSSSVSREKVTKMKECNLRYGANSM